MYERRLGQLAEGGVEGGGGEVEAAKAVGAADDELERVVEALDGAGDPTGIDPAVQNGSISRNGVPVRSTLPTPLAWPAWQPMLLDDLLRARPALASLAEPT